MSNNANRTFIVIVAALWIVAMAVLIFFTWTADTDVIDRLGDFVEYLDAHNDDPGKLIVTLSALVTVVLALLLIIVEVAPEDEERELRVEQAGATTIVPATALRQRLEEALVALPDVTDAKAKVTTKDKGIMAALDITLLPTANVAAVTQDASRIVIDTVQTDLGLPVVGVPAVKIAFAKGGTPVASSMAQAPSPPPATTEEHPEPAAEKVPEPPVPEDQTQPAGDQPAPPSAPYNPWSPPPSQPPTAEEPQTPVPDQPPPATPYNPWSPPPSAPAPEPPPAEGQDEPEDRQP